MSPDEKKIKTLRGKITQFKGQITRAARFATEQAEQVLVDIEGLKIRMEDLQKGLSAYKTHALEIKLLTENDEDNGDESFSEDDVEDKCYTVMANLRTIIRASEQSAEPPSPPPNVTALPTSAPQSSKLPPLDIAHFDGRDITQYTPFIGIFEAIVDKDANLSPVQKLYYLRKYLQGDALMLISGLPLLNESYKQALNLLNKRYNNKTLLISHHVNMLLDYQPISKGSSHELRHLVSTVRQHLGALTSLGQQTQYWDMVIVPILLRKLDSYSCRAYYAERDQTKLPVLEELLEFIERRAMGYEESNTTTSKSTFNKFIKAANLAHISDNKVVGSLCRFCHEADHKIFACKKYRALSAQDRIKFATDEKLCKICLNLHQKKCQFHFKCSLCKSKEHNSLLHSESMVNNIAHAQNLTVPENMVLLPTIKVKFRANDGSFVTAKGLVDSGSQISFISNNLINQLKVAPFDCHVNVTALGQQRKPIAKAVNLSMHSLNSSYSCSALFSVVDNITTYLPQTKFELRDLSIPSTIKLADTEYNIPGEISFLIAADIFFKIMLPDKIALSGNNLFLMATRFGYIVSGNLNKNNVCLFSPTLKNDRVGLHATTDNQMDALLQRFWEEQNVPEIKTECIDRNNVCEVEFQNSTQLINNRFQVKLPLKVPIEEVKLGDSFSVALQRLNALCKKFKKDPELKKCYTEFINEFVALGHATVIDIFQLEKDLDCCYFLPHHAVLKEDSVTTRLRAVFDGSAKTNLNLSLNDILESGPVVQRELFDILVLFRTYKYVALTDIRQMYRQVAIDPSQTHLQLILWKENLDDPLICLQLTRITYGITSSSFLATRCLVELAQRYERQYPLASSVLKNNSYVDDCLFGATTLDEVRQARDELIELTSRGSFELHKWCANHQDILAGIPSNKQRFQDVNLNNTDLTTKALGLSLNLISDEFKISRPIGQLPAKWTKRSVLSFIGTFFDPLGLAGPILTKAKEFLQKVWKQKLGWDVSIPDELLSSWNSFFSDLMYMRNINVKRDLMTSGADYVQLIGYCDASFIASSACIYVRAVHGEKVYVTLLCSKSRIAPIKGNLTIPRLELNACLLLAKLYTKVHSILPFAIKDCLLFSDSQVALCWLQNPPSKDSYVLNRVVSINSQTKDCVWIHVSGSCNPADCLSRGLMPSELATNSLWWQGHPELHNVNFSIDAKKSYKNNSSITTICTEPNVNCNIVDEVIPVSKFSSISKLQRIICYVLRFINNCKLKKGQRNGTKQISFKEYKQSMHTIIKYVQSLHFEEEIGCIKNNKCIKTNLKKLCVFLDSDGILRVGGRLDNASIPFSQKHPIILPKQCNITTQVICHEHRALLHAGLKLTLSSLAQKYYIIGVTTVVKKIISKCVPCFKFRAQRAQQLMAALPQDRVVQDRPFMKTGMDYCGPFSIKQSSIRRSIVTKGYVCIFVCFVTKCVHLELVSDLTTESFLAAFKRFYCRRGLPRIVYCDNASTFKGANNQLKKLYELCKSQSHQNSVVNHCNEQGFEFKFIPSYSPTWGGLWESAVKSAKYHFKRIIGNLILTYEQFNTIIIHVEAVLNSRPITQVSSDISDFTFLTPGHFLVQGALAAPPDQEIESNNINVLHFWKKCTKIQQDFWRVWHKSYLSQLLSRPKWHKVNPDVKEGVLVLLIGEKVSPLQWPVARVIKVFKGSDSLVRAVEVKTKNGSHTRAINKIAVLPIYD